MKKLVVGFWLLAVGAAGAARAAVAATGGTEVSDATISGKTFSGTYDKSVYIVKGGEKNVTFENCTFDGVSAKSNGSCVYINRGSGSGKVIFRNCRFINCGTEGEYDGGAIYVENIENVNQKVIFENCVAFGCQAEEGGFLYCNDKEAVIEGVGTTVISDCSAVKGGGVYINRINTFDGFILTDNTSTKGGGGIYNDNGSAGVSTISNCRFYRNDTGSGYKGGGLYFDDDNGFVEDCRFLENTAGTGADYYIDDTSTSRTGLLSTSDFANRTFAGGGTENDPYLIKNDVDWDALYYKVAKGNDYSAKYIKLAADITATTSISDGGDNAVDFRGTFDGNGKTITLRLAANMSYIAPFKYTERACIKNLRVDGCVIGAGNGCSVGGIVGYARDSRVENCVNCAEVRGTDEETGGIVGLSYGTIISECVNNGTVSGGYNVGGIVGWMTSSAKVRNALNNGSVSSAQHVGGIVGYENTSVVLENCHSPGSVAATSSQYVGGITGCANFASTHELCLYDKEKCPDNGYGTGVSHAALWGDGSEAVFELPEAMEEINDYIATHDKEKDGWLRVAFDRNGRPVFVPNGLTDELGYSVGRISETEYVFWKLGKLYKVTDGVAVELPHAVVTANTGSLGNGWYVVEGVVSRTSSISVSGSANLVLLDGASLTVDCSGGQYVAGIEIEDENLLRVFGVESGSLTAFGGENAAGIGTAKKLHGGAVWDCHTCGHIEIYGGTVTATGGKGGAGIGGGYTGAGGTVTINGGMVTAYGKNGGASIGAGYDGGSGGSLTIGPRVFKIDENHWAESDAVVTFNPGQFGLQLSSASADGGRFKRTLVNETWICALEVGHRLTLNFEPVFLGNRIVGSSTVTVGPVLEDTVLGTEDLPSVETPILSVDYINEGGTPSTASARLVSAISQQTTMREGWYVVTDEVTIATTEVSGKVNLILADGAKLTVNGGIGVDRYKKLTIYAQQGGSGELIANGAKNCAGIGGRNPNCTSGLGNCGIVIIYGGVVTATGGEAGAGIGGGYGGPGGTVMINGGTVTASGGTGAAGIGGGVYAAGGDVTINGGTVTASGGTGAAGIGGGYKGSSDGAFELGKGVAFVNGVHGRSCSFVEIAERAFPTCENGKIEELDGVWVVTPDEGVTAVRIANLPAGDALVVPPTVTQVIGADDEQIRVRDGNVDVTAQYLIHGGVISPFETFDDGHHYVESTAEEEPYIDTGYVPTVNTRIVADFNSMERSAIWSVFFGVTKSDSAGDGVLLRYTKYDDMSLNAWFCGSSDQITGFDGKRLAAELKAGSLTLGTDDGTNTYEIPKNGTTPYNGPIYIFCGNNGGSVWRPQAMQLYSFQIYDTVDNKANQLVRDFVPFRTTDGTEIVGLYDRVTQKCFINAGGGSLTLGEDPMPTCEGGEIAEVDGVWVVTPEGNVAAVTIKNLPDGATVAVKLNGYTVPAAAFMGFGTGENANVFSLALDPAGVVNGVKVTPTIGELSENEGEPFVVGEGCAAVTIRSIPGLKYELKRTTNLAADFGSIGDGVKAVGTGAPVTLEDTDPPSGAAFYTIGVSVP